MVRGFLVRCEMTRTLIKGALGAAFESLIIWVASFFASALRSREKASRASVCFAFRLVGSMLRSLTIFSGMPSVGVWPVRAVMRKRPMVCCVPYC